MVKQNIWEVIGETLIVPRQRIIVASTFDEYVKSLAPWEQELVRHTELSNDPFIVSGFLAQAIRAVSDGSVWFKAQGAFGWIISDSLGTRVASGMGPVSGATQNSYRSEAVGLLSLLLFLRHLAEFTGRTASWQGIIATDSQSLLDNLLQWETSSEANQQEWQHRISAGDVMIPEWDVLVEICYLVRTMPGITLQYVRGHQDRHTPYNRLPLLAQLNVDADAMANRFQREHGRGRPISLLFPHTGVHLDLPQGTVTANHQSAIRLRAVGEPLQAYLQQKYAWSPSTSALINWEAHAMALRRHPQRRTHLTKLIHDILPTNSRVHRNDRSRQSCPSCSHHREDRDHVLRCQGISRINTRREMLRCIQEGCARTQTCPQLTTLLLQSIGGWLDDKSSDVPYSPDPRDFPPELARLIRHQSSIGWRQLFNGRFCSEWAKRQEVYYSRLPDQARSNRLTGVQWHVAESHHRSSMGRLVYNMGTEKWRSARIR